MRDYQGVRNLCCLDVFGFSGSMAKHWTKKGFPAIQYDIALNPRSDDLLGKRGYLHLTRLGLRLVQGAMVILGPPCAMNIYLSTSVHKRHIFGPEGDTSNKRVRMSNLLASNMACFLELLSRHRSFWFIVEQPSSSYLFKMEFMLALSALLFCKKIHTWLAFFGHDLPKPTHLVGTLPDMGTLCKKMTKADRAKFRARLERRQAKRKIPRKYYIKEKKDGEQKKMSVHGCKDLAFSAHYPSGFAHAIFKLWITAFQNL